MQNKSFENLTDEQIVRMVVQGNKNLYSQIISRYQNKLFRYVNFLLNDESKAQDVVQETFIKAYINLKGFDTKRKFSSWVYRIAHNEATNLIKKHKRFVSIDKDMDFDSGLDVEDDYIKFEISKNTHKCLEEMDIIYREVLSLYYLDGKSYQEISEILRLPVGTVSIRIKRAKSIMKKICQNKMKMQNK